MASKMIDVVMGVLGVVFISAFLIGMGVIIVSLLNQLGSV